MTSILRAGALVALLAVVGCSGDDLASSGGSGGGGASSGAGGVSGSSGQGGQDQAGQGGDTSAAGTTSAGGAAGTDSTAGTGGVAGSDSTAGSAGSGGSMVEPAGGVGGAGGASGGSGQGGTSPTECNCPDGLLFGGGKGECEMPANVKASDSLGSEKAMGAVDGSISNPWPGGGTLEVRLEEVQTMFSLTLRPYVSTPLPVGSQGVTVDIKLEVSDGGATSMYSKQVKGLNGDDIPVVIPLTASTEVKKIKVTLTSVLTGAGGGLQIGLKEVSFHTCKDGSSSP